MNRRAPSRITALTPAQAAIPNYDLAEWLGVDENLPELEGITLAASDICARYLGRDLIARDWLALWWDWPVYGNRSLPTLSGVEGRANPEIQLPYGPVIVVDSLELYGENVTDFVTREDSIVIPNRLFPGDAYGHNEVPAIRVEYFAGIVELAEELPASLAQAVKMVAAFLFENRGDCDTGNVIHDSGAAILLAPWRSPEVIA